MAVNGIGAPRGGEPHRRMYAGEKRRLTEESDHQVDYA
jgi:hypothetical protein